MIVHHPTQTNSNGHIKISSRFEMQKTIPYLPKELWFSFPERYAGQINSRSDAFIPSALLLAMYTGEDLDVRGAVSPRLTDHITEYRDVIYSWYPKLFKRVNIAYDHLETPAQPIGSTSVCTAFSGGVDSFYTLWTNLPQNQAILEAQITHGLFVHGLDLRLEDNANYQAAAVPFSDLFKDLGLDLIQAATNAYQFSEFRINWAIFSGVPLIGAALLLAPWLRRFYIPSGFLEESAPLKDHLFSTESTELIHNGASINRTEKLEALLKWPATHHKIRVCANKLKMTGLQNCSSCHKCYRTKVSLELLNALPKYNNFSQHKMTPVDYLRWGVLYPLNVDAATFIRNQAIQHSQKDIAFWIRIAIILRIASKFLRKSLKSLLSDKQLYALKRKFFPPESLQS